MPRARLLPWLLVVACPFLAGGWSLNYPTPGSYVPKRNAPGTGNAPQYETFKYKIMEPNTGGTVLDGEVVSSTSTGGFYVYIWGQPDNDPLSPGAGHIALLTDGSDNVYVSVPNVTVMP